MKTCPVCALDLEDTCAAEYPLTFSACPVHKLPLTKHRVPRQFSSGSATFVPNPDPQPTVARTQVERHKPAKLSGLALVRPQIEIVNHIASDVVADSDQESARDSVAEIGSRESGSDSAFAGSVPAFDYQTSLTDAREQGMERPGFRVAAIATIIGLAVFGLVAVYVLVSGISRRSASNSAKVAVNAQTPSQSAPFVPTPQEAQDYKEEAPAPKAPAPAEAVSTRPVERARNEVVSPSQPKNSAPENAGSRSAGLPKVMSPPAPVASSARVSNPPMPPLPREPSGGFDARLVRMRSTKTTAGFRYEMTFNMQEQAGRSAQWQRVLISTRSANGTSHSEAIPFSHRLGAAGALTFTISVEMKGRSESDWQGRIVCTTIGWDNKGAPLQSSFGASVAP
jgi:hypothetical protein